MVTFASEGLRTLVCAQRVIPEEEFNEWIVEYHDAMAALVERDEKLEAVAEKIEKNLTIVGCTAIEDKLQDGVPKTIVDLGEFKPKTLIIFIHRSQDINFI